MTEHGDDDVLESEATSAPDSHDLDAVCEKWVAWCRARRLYWPAPQHAGEIVRRGGGTRPLRNDIPEAISGPSLAAFHIAYTCQPDSLDKQVFDLYYLARVTPVKSAAAALGIGRSRFYRLLFDFRQRVDLAARAFEQNVPVPVQLVAASHAEGRLVNRSVVPDSEDNTGHHAAG